ncbi:hypothetical protein QQ045_012117 [Rhodiola kirilowii]
MAAANCFTVALLKSLRQTPVAISSSSTSTSVSSPPNFGTRRNHLRPKILRTLTKPYPTPTTPIPTPLVPLKIPEITEEDIGKRDVEEAAVEARIERDDAVMVTSEVGTEMAVDNLSAKLDMKAVGLSAVGLFVLQTVCAVLIFGSAGVSRDSGDHESESGDSEKERLLLEDDGRIRRIMSKASAFVKVDESVLEERIVEIRAMARQAREREAKAGRLKSDVDGFRDDDDEVVDEIEKEVSARLVRLQKKLATFQDKLPVNNMSKVEKGSGSSNVVNGSLVFEKKKTFRSSVTTKPISDAKGFSNVTDHRDSLPSTNILPLEPEAGGNSPINVSSTLNEEADKKMVRKKALELKRRIANKKTEASIVEPNASDVQDFSRVKPVDTSKSWTLMEASQQEVVKHDKNDALSLNGSSKNKGFGETAVGRTVRNKGSDNEAASWWLHLPYVFAILMHQGSGDEGQGGLYTLKATAKVPQKHDEAYTVAFEDRGDVNKFCYILESFFEDMTDFSADVVPLPTKEMREPVGSGVLNVIIVKKGQLELYAGQPLGEVETLIRSLVL